MLAFDLDGVLVSDVDYSKVAINDYSIRNKLEANFVPDGDYVIITSRPELDRKATMEWIEFNLKDNPPKKVYMRSTLNIGAASYKYSVLLQLPEITMFVESNRGVVMALRREFKNIDRGSTLQIIDFAKIVGKIFLLFDMEN